jgi:hypothetical protein
LCLRYNPLCGYYGACVLTRRRVEVNNNLFTVARPLMAVVLALLLTWSVSSCACRCPEGFHKVKVESREVTTPGRYVWKTDFATGRGWYQWQNAEKHEVSTYACDSDDPNGPKGQPCQ